MPLQFDGTVDGAICQLQYLAEAQARALVEPDLELLDRLGAKREQLQQWLRRERCVAFSPQQLADLREVTQLDERNVRTLHALLRETAAELQTIQRGRGVMHAYQSPSGLHASPRLNQVG